jgi:hypothetical protein
MQFSEGVLLGVLTAAGVLATAGAGLSPQAGRPMIAWFPGGDAMALEAVVEAGGTVLAVGPVPGAITTVSSSPRFAAKLSAAGAGLIAAYRGSPICGAPASSSSSRSPS